MSDWNLKTFLGKAARVLISLAFIAFMIEIFVHSMHFSLKYALPSVSVETKEVLGLAGMFLTARYFWKFLIWLETQVAD